MPASEGLILKVLAGVLLSGLLTVGIVLTHIGILKDTVESQAKRSNVKDGAATTHGPTEAQSSQRGHLPQSHGRNFNDDSCVPGRTVIVHLFNWKWTDIALECERFLGPKGFCGVQVSPPNEHLIITNPNRPWYERYQPVSYKLDSRSGSRQEFADMVGRCNAVNVRIYVDAVINHMSASGSGVGSGGSSYDTNTQSYPGVPYGSTDFNCCGCDAPSACHTENCEIRDFNNAIQVRNCRLVGLQDLALGKEYVRTKVADYLNDLIGLGVAGFRVDACKHMWPGDIEAVYAKIHDLNPRWFPPHTKPFVFNEVIDRGGESISAKEYTHLGRITEFRYCDEIGNAFRRHYTLKNLRTIGESWNMLPDDKALVFVDNHDNQRGHGGAGSTILTFYQPREYKMATAFMLAHPYGFTRIMSSYQWEGGPSHNDWIGPPSHDNGTIQDITIDEEGQCEGDWVCEHRWHPITSMVKFRNVAKGEPMLNWFDNNYDQIAFSRGRKAFIALNNEVVGDLHQRLQTGLPPGYYCDVISGDVIDGSCTGKIVEVNATGHALISISSDSEVPIVAFHIGSRANQPPIGLDIGWDWEVNQTMIPPKEGFQKTIVLIHYRSLFGQDLFIRGGIDVNRREGCSVENASNPCSIDIRYESLGSGGHHAKYNSWREGDTKLDWHGAEPGQGLFFDQPSHGSPTLWTTNVKDHDGYQPINRYKPHYWMWEVQMNCSQTEDGWFEFKCFVSQGRRGGIWEGDIAQPEECSGNVGGRRPHFGRNHFARCGYINMYNYNRHDCRITSF